MLLRSSSYFERSPALLAATEARRDALEASVADLLGTAWRGIESLLHDSLSTLAERVEHAAREELSERGARLEAGIEATRRTAELRERQVRVEKAFAVRDALERRGASLGLEGLDLERRRLKAALEASERRRREAEERVQTLETMIARSKADKARESAMRQQCVLATAQRRPLHAAPAALSAASGSGAATSNGRSLPPPHGMPSRSAGQQPLNAAPSPQQRATSQARRPPQKSAPTEASGSESRLPERELELDERLAERLAQERLMQRMAEMERT